MTTVLLVDPVAFTRKLFARALALRGYRVIQAASGREAIAAYGEARPDIVAIDHRLPDLDGVKTLRAIKALDPAMRAILTGPVTTPEPVVAARRAGALDYVARPLADDRVFTIISKLLSPVVA